MEMRKYLFFVLFSIGILILSCSRNTYIGKSFERRFEITDYSNDSFYVQGKKYEITFECDSLDLIKYRTQGENFYAFLVFFQEEDDRQDKFELIKLKHIKENIFQSSFTVPPWATRFMVSIQDCEGTRYVSWIEMPVVEQNGELPKGAIRCYFREDKNGEHFQEYVDYELNRNKNFLVFAAKWFYELKYKLMKNEQLDNDIMYIQKYCRDIPTRVTLLTIGFYLSKQENKFNKYIDTLLMLDNIAGLNNDFVCNFLYQMFPYNSFDTSSFEPRLEKLLLANPNSLLFDWILSDGSFRKLPFIKFMDCLEKRTRQSKYKFEEELAKYIVFVEKKLVDSVRKSLPLIEKYLNLLYNRNYLDDYAALNNIIYFKKSLLLTYVYEGYSLLKDFHKGIEILKKGITLFEPLDFDNFFYYEGIARCYEKIGHLDSSLHYYLLAYKMNPTSAKMKQEIIGLMSKLNINASNNEGWITEKINHINFSSNIILNQRLFIEMTNGNKIYLKGSNNTRLILIFFNTTCSVCLKEMLFFNKYLQKFQEAGISIFVVSSEPLEKVTEFIEGRKIAIPTIRNGAEISRYFNIRVYPTTITIDSNGKIEHFLIGFGNPSESLYLNFLKSH